MRSETKKGFAAPPYAYARNNSLNYVDKNGLNTLSSSWWTAPVVPLLPQVASVLPQVAGAGLFGAGIGIGTGFTVGTLVIGNGQFPDPGAGVAYPAGTTQPPVPLPHPPSEPGVPTIPTSQTPPICGDSSPSSSRSSRCREAAEMCREECLDSMDGTGFGFWNCVNACLAAAGCTPGMY